MAAVSDGVPRSRQADVMANGHDNGGGRRLQCLNMRVVDVFGPSVDEADCDRPAVGVEMSRIHRSCSGWERRRGPKGGRGDFRVEDGEGGMDPGKRDRPGGKLLRPTVGRKGARRWLGTDYQQGVVKRRITVGTQGVEQSGGTGTVVLTAPCKNVILAWPVGIPR